MGIMKLEYDVEEIWIIERYYRGKWFHWATRTNEEQAKKLNEGLNKTKGEYRISKFIRFKAENQIEINLEECYMNGKTT